jgi:hypothetical protein
MKAGILAVYAALTLMVAIPTAANAVGVGQTCDGVATNPKTCDPGLFCQRKSGTCFMADIPGTCTGVPRFCPEDTGPTLKVCGCDGKTYKNDCFGQQAKVSLALMMAAD